MPMISGIQNRNGATSEIGIDEWPSITGEISYAGISVTGYINTDISITGEITMPESEQIEIYTGITNIIPSTRNDILLKTQYKKVLDNITVQKILYSQVTNESGGFTVTIGDENG